MKKQVFLIITLVIMSNLCASNPDAYSPPGYNSGGPYGRQPIASAPTVPELQSQEEYDPTQDALRDQASQTIVNNGCMCFCLLNPRVIPVLHRLSFALFGTTDTTDNTNHCSSENVNVHNRPRALTLKEEKAA